ncbi:arylsulfatase [Acidobacteria bacterium AH-259-A15]|nr:arylsulfatase [Acidobacteria bacterium AH-259-A15]
MTRWRYLTRVAAMAACFALSSSVRAEQVERPNILLIMVDDMGYSDLGCYGGEIRTPNIDGLARNGLRFSQFYNAARCCPTRTSLLTGLYPHEVGMGGMVNGKGPGPYQGYLNDECVTLAEVLKSAGYTTYMSGKWHVGEERPNWPVDRGFDRYYGLISGAMNYFDISKVKAQGSVRHFAIDGTENRPPSEGFYATDAFTDQAVAFINEHEDKTKPFFMYLAYTAPHWPLHALPQDIARYRGQYMQGWSELRKQRYQRQLKMGLIDPQWKLSPQDPAAADWGKVKDKETMDLKMAIYAAQIDRMDQGVGKVLTVLKARSLFENTLILFLSDNGASHESGPLGRDWRKGKGGPLGGVDSYQSYGLSWSNASNTPFRKHKHWVHEGGISTPLIVHWPGKIRKVGSITHQPGHIVDIVATCCDVAGATYPQRFKGKKIKPMRGRSLVPLFGGKTRRGHEVLYWEHMGNRAIRAGKWKLVLMKGREWELYDMEADRAELNNLAAQRPELLDKLKSKYESWAKKVGVR